VILFISDLHLDASRPAVAEAFFDFLAKDAVKANALYILGDLFELWVGDDDDDPFVLLVQTKLKQLSETGTAVYFMHGNRDFLIGERFANNSGVILLPDPFPLEIDNTTVVLMHGDSLCTRDRAYQAFRAESRSKAWFDKVLGLSLSERRALGQQLRQQSKTMSSRKADDIMDVSNDAVEKVFTEFGADKLIHGHTHRPCRHLLSFNGQSSNSQGPERIVLGDWDNLAWCLRFEGDWYLESWPISEAPA
jgi:UDP-2,3-diacylglucosamine hydrolase